MSIAYYEKLVQEDLDVGVALTSKRNPGGGTLTATQVGIHTLAVGQLKTTQTWAPGTVAADASANTTVTVAGAAVGDFVLASLDSMGSGELILSAHVSAASTVYVNLHNTSAASIAVSSGNLNVLVLKSA